MIEVNVVNVATGEVSTVPEHWLKNKVLINPDVYVRQDLDESNEKDESKTSETSKPDASESKEPAKGKTKAGKTKKEEDPS